MALQHIIASLQATLAEEAASRKRHRYIREEATLQATRHALDKGDREQWLQDTLETEAILG